MRLRLLLLASLGALAAGAAAWILRPGGGGPEAGSRLRILFTGETLGELESCDCTSETTGGLPRRGGFIEAQERPFLLLDTGCVGNGAREFEVLRAEAVLRGMLVLGYDAANVGEHELWLGEERLRRLLEVGVPFVSANAIGESGTPVARTHRVLGVAGLHVAVTGLVTPSPYALGSGLRVEPPRESLARILPALRREAGVVVVLADLELAEVRELARDYPEVTAFLFRGRGDSHAPEIVNRSVIASIYGEARYVGDLELLWETERRFEVARGEAVLLDSRFGESSAVREAAIDRYKEAIRGRTFDLAEPEPGWSRIQPIQPEPGNAHVGSEACRRCHPSQLERWSANRHAVALESLRKLGYESSPECVVCHVVGYGAADGFASAETTPELARVGCEACHGPGKALLEGDCATLARPTGEADCRACHTPKHDPGFVYEEAWAKIDHTKGGR